ncbi:putative signal transducing protein [Marinobacter sp. C2H3]|uniref:putative signal transducing protein n=1 Tax=Marinobacter sp. C2H3 TaxID=3119003 RepID=UPI00300F2BD9
MQIAYRARDFTEAHIIAGLLQAHGIDAHVGGHYLQGALGEIGASDFSTVHVDDDDFLRARELVGEYEQSRPAEAAPRVPQERPDRYARWFLLALAVTLWCLLVPD